jgi:hypothetical protein
MSATPTTKARAANPRVIPVAVNYLSAENLRFIVSACDSPSLSGPDFHAMHGAQKLAFLTVIETAFREMDGNHLGTIVSMWGELTTDQRKDLTRTAIECSIAQLKATRIQPKPKPENRGLQVVASNRRERPAKSFSPARKFTVVSRTTRPTKPVVVSVPTSNGPEAA